MVFVLISTVKNMCAQAKFSVFCFDGAPREGWPTTYGFAVVKAGRHKLHFSCSHLECRLDSANCIGVLAIQCMRLSVSYANVVNVALDTTTSFVLGLFLISSAIEIV